MDKRGQEIICPKCGSFVSGNFCSNCGEKLEKEPAKEEEPQTEKEHGEEKDEDKGSLKGAAVTENSEGEKSAEKENKTLKDTVKSTYIFVKNIPNKVKIIILVFLLLIASVIAFNVFYCEHEQVTVFNDYYKAVCGENKVKHYVCNDCGEAWDEETSEVGDHIYAESQEKILKESTCTEKGEKETACILCGEKKQENIKAKGHSYTKTEVIKIATCTDVGEAIYSCSVCGLTKTVETPKDDSNHNYANKVYDWSTSTYNSDGTISATAVDHCTRCEKEYRGEENVSADTFKSVCKKYSWSELRGLKGTPVSVNVKVTQELDGNALASISGSYGDMILIRNCSAYENSTITVYGLADGEFSYTTVLGAGKTVPAIKALLY